MRLRPTAAILPVLLAGCGSAPTLTPAQMRSAVTTTMEGCDSAVHVLTVNLAHATPVGIYQMAGTVESECQGATLGLMRVSAPDACRDASEAARLMADAVQDAANQPVAENLVRAQNALGMASAQRNQCDSAIKKIQPA